jgi:hypothetical protein
MIIMPESRNDEETLSLEDESTRSRSVSPFDSEHWWDIKKRCNTAGIMIEERTLPSATSASEKTRNRRIMGAIFIPTAGRSDRMVALFPSDFKKFREIQFEKYAILGDYFATWDARNGTIEVRLRTDSAPFSPIIRRLPGLEDLDVVESASSVTSDSENSGEGVVNDEDNTRIQVSRYPPKRWRVRVSSGAAEIEISPASDEFQVFFGNSAGVSSPTLKMAGIYIDDASQALESLETIGNAFLFDLDIRSGIRLTLQRDRHAGVPMRRSVPDDSPPRYPVSIYPKEPMELYEYGRTATGFPLLQFLAYYQAVEFFFPVYSRQENIRKLRLILKDPRFDVNDDVDLNKALSAIPSDGRQGEREQLRATLRACIEPSTIREIVESSAEYTKYFTHKDQAIKGAPRILLHPGQSDLRDQAAERIYAIRCRVVHTKHDGGDGAGELLLPSSPEARSLLPDVDLMRLVAQWVIIAAAQTLHLRTR